MSYTAKVFYVLESDPTYTLKYDSLVKDVNIGDSFSLSFWILTITKLITT